MKKMNIKARERSAIVQSLMAGVVPRIGLQHIQVGRKHEILAMIDDLERIRARGATIRFVVGKFGTGKSFFLNLTKSVALEKKFVVMQADITPTRRLFGTGGQARGLYTELLRSMSTKAKPEGGALQSVIERWISGLIERHGEDADIASLLREELKPLQNYVSGFDPATVLIRYFNAYRSGDDEALDAALSWLLAEYETKTEAREALGVRSIIADKDIYDYLKLWSAFVRLAGYAGLLINIDEMGVLAERLNNAQARNYNYEVVHHILNDCLQGSAAGIGFIFAGTDVFMDDPAKGLIGYGALASRLAPNPFASADVRDYASPVLRLPALSGEDIYLLLHKIRDVFASGDPAKYLVPDEAIDLFIGRCSRVLGRDFYQTPREASKSFAALLSLLQQNPELNWRALLDDTKLQSTGI